MVVCGDTSFLFSLYGNDANSARAVSWANSNKLPIILSPYNPYELGNALRFAAFRKSLKPSEAAIFWSQFEAAMTAGRLLRQPCSLANVLEEATRLSSAYTIAYGHRTFDIIYVAAALVLGADEFLTFTFDAIQRTLALSEGLLVSI